MYLVALTLLTVYEFAVDGIGFPFDFESPLIT